VQSASNHYVVPARLQDCAGHRCEWTAFLRPTSPVAGVHNITVEVQRPDAVLQRPVVGQQEAPLSPQLLHDIVFGDVWICAGQSNMWLPLSHTFQRQASIAAARRGAYNNIRLTCGNSGGAEENLYPPWLRAAECASPIGADVDGSDGAADSGLGSSRGGGGGERVDPQQAGKAGGTRMSRMHSFCGTCWYFGQALTDSLVAAGEPPPTLGLVCIAAVGSQIENWMPDSAHLGITCRHQMATATPIGHFFRKRMQPFTRMSVKGWIWAQGESNLRTNAVSGSWLGRLGYGCALPLLVRTWRDAWSSAGANTTQPLAPFGVVVLAPRSGYPGGSRDYGGMRWSQTANFGTLPNLAMPNTFLAQTYDLHDPWHVTADCISWSCCRHNGREPMAGFNASSCARATRSLGTPHGVCGPFCDVMARTPLQMPSMPGLHPRLKRMIGQRLATAAVRQVYGKGKGAATGPTLSGCEVRGGELILRFNQDLLDGEHVLVRDSASKLIPSLLEVVRRRRASGYCVQPMQRCPRNATACHRRDREWHCPSGMGQEYDPAALSKDGLADFVPITGFFNLAYMPKDTTYSAAWEPVPVRALPGSTHEVVADLHSLQGEDIFALRYAWGEALCCPEADPLIATANRKACRAASCPLVGSGGLPANPFLARVIGGRCRCLPPQVCDE